MSELQTYQCRKCGKKEEAANAPECCGEKMTVMPLEVCTQADGPEHARTNNNDLPCDDSRGG